MTINKPVDFKGHCMRRLSVTGSLDANLTEFGLVACVWACMVCLCRELIMNH